MADKVGSEHILEQADKEHLDNLAVEEHTLGAEESPVVDSLDQLHSLAADSSLLVAARSLGSEDSNRAAATAVLVGSDHTSLAAGTDQLQAAA